MITYKDKAVYIVSRYVYNMDSFGCLFNNYLTWDNKNLKSMDFNDLATIKSTMTQSASSLKAGDVLYFTPSSKFPRFKVGASEYKRCIKPEKADYCVIGNHNLKEVKNCVVAENNSYYFVFYDMASINPPYGSSWQTKFNQYIKDPINYLNNSTLAQFKDDPIKVVYNGAVTFSSQPELWKYMDGTYKNFITDNQLDTAINGKLTQLDKEAIDSVKTFLDSPDYATKAVGLKLLTGYNVQEFPYTLRSIIIPRWHTLRSLPEWKSSGVQQLIKSIGLDPTVRHGYEWRYPYVQALLPKPEDIPTANPADLENVKAEFIKMVDEDIKKTISIAKQSRIIDTYNLEITYEIKEN